MNEKMLEAVMEATKTELLAYYHAITNGADPREALAYHMQNLRVIHYAMANNRGWSIPRGTADMVMIQIVSTQALRKAFLTQTGDEPSPDAVDAFNKVLGPLMLSPGLN